METITAAVAVAALRKAVEDKGRDHIAPQYDTVFNEETEQYDHPVMAEGLHGTCRYADPEDVTVPSCIVGNVLAQFGLLAEAVPFEGNTASAVVTRLSVPVEGLAVDVLCRAQRVQDRGESWGNALDAAEQLAASYGV